MPISNETAQHRRLSWRAKGLLLDLLSFPDGYTITFDRLMAAAKACGDPDVEGRDAMRRAMQELERKGYLAHQRVAVPNPAPGKQRWRTQTAICDQPIFAKGAEGTDSQEAQDSGPPDFRTSSDQEASKKTGFNKNDQQQEEAGKSSSSLASAREGQQAGKQDRRAALERTWALVDRLREPQLRNALLDFERKRPAIYRECRQAAISQFQNGEVSVLKGESRGLATDRLSYKYAIQHYAEKLPPWIVKHLRDAA